MSPTANDPVPSGTASPLWNKSVLVAEDEGLMQMHLRRLLVQKGAAMALAARSGPESVEIFLEMRPDLVLMDVDMPGEYDGLEAARRILEAQPACIVMLSGFSDEAHQERACQIGVYAYLVKPITLETIVPALEAALQEFEQAQCG